MYMGVLLTVQCQSEVIRRILDFLALLDYVSRAHEIKIRPSSVRRPSVASIISEVTAWIAFKFQLWLRLGHMPRRFFFLIFFLIF